MAFFSLQNISIKGVAAAVPTNIVDNNTYDWISAEDREKFIRTTGVAQRRAVSEGTATSDLCYQAAEDLLKELGWKREEVQLLVFVSQMRDYVYPSTSTILQHRLGLPKSCLAFDVPLGCSGYVYGLSIVGSMMQSADIEKAILLAGDACTPVLNYKDKSTYPLFGDAGSATALAFDTSASPMYFNLQTDGEGYEAIIMRDGGMRSPIDVNSFEEKEFSPGIVHNSMQIELDGMKLFEFTMQEVSDNISHTLKQSGKSKDEVDYFVLHQANKLMNETVRKVLKVEPERFPYSIDRYGNTNSASIPMTIVSELAEQVASSTNKFLLSGFGVGLSWGSIYLESAPFVCLPLIEYKPS